MPSKTVEAGVLPSTGGLIGDAASPQALARLARAVSGTGTSRSIRAKVAPERQRKSLLLIRSALKSIVDRDYDGASKTVLKVLDLDARNGLAWHVLAIAREKLGDLVQAFKAYEAAVALLPDDSAVAHDLGRLAHRLGHLPIAEKLLSRYLFRNPGDIEATNNLACVLRDENRYVEAIDLLRSTLAAFPESPVLWNTLGTVLTDRGDMADSLVFFDEALRLEAGFYKARYNRANALMTLGQPERALIDIDAAMVGVGDPLERATMVMAKALTQLMIGDLSEGFETYEVRFDPALPRAVHFETFGTRWTPGDVLKGSSLLVYGEQGLGDEVLFANVLADVVDAMGSDGRLTLVVEPRLTALFQRSFPSTTVLAHRTVKHMGASYRRVVAPDPRPEPDRWIQIGSLFRAFRERLDRFPTRRGFLTADPVRIAHWRDVLARQGPGPNVGVLWKSLRMEGSRARSYSPFELWRPVLSTPGVRFVNLQYGDASAELEDARQRGLDIWTPPGIDLKDDLDDLAALCAALDLVVGPSTATTNIAAAMGTPVWLTTGPDAWPRFGTESFPCYPSMRLFPATGFGQWEDVMLRMAEAMRAEFPNAAAP